MLCTSCIAEASKRLEPIVQQVMLDILNDLKQEKFNQ